MITVERLCKSFGSLAAVDDVTFSVNEGEIFGLLGPNGAGKTTSIIMSGWSCSSLPQSSLPSG